MAVIDQIKKIRDNLAEYPHVRLVAATKYFNIEKTKEIIEAGVTDIGENRKDVFLEKYNALKEYPITWHFFGTIKIPPKLTSNFVDSIDYLHSLDSIDLANALNKARKASEPLKCFIQVNLSNNANRTGITDAKLIPFVKNLVKYPKLQIVGLMTIASFTFDDEVLATYFRTLQELQKEVQALNLPYAPCNELSMGMSNDYKIALKYGATMVRIGTLLSK